MNDPGPPSTVRDLLRHLRKPQVATVMAGIALILGLSGPFDTWATQSLPERLVYWTLVVWLTYGTGFLVTGVTASRLGAVSLAMRSGAVALAVACSVYAVLLALNLVWGLYPETLASALRCFGAVLVICLVIEVTFQVMSASQTGASAMSGPPDAKPAPDVPALMRRLPLDKRGELLSLSVQDHYVDVVTTKGREMLLMRFGDAMREAAPVAGLQVHRSYWVAKAAVVKVARRGDGAVVTLTNGTTLPVSRTYVPALRSAALLPARTA